MNMCHRCSREYASRKSLWNRRQICNLSYAYDNASPIIGEKRKPGFGNQFQDLLPLVNGQRLKADIFGYSDDDEESPKKLKQCPDPDLINRIVNTSFQQVTSHLSHVS